MVGAMKECFGDEWGNKVHIVRDEDDCDSERDFAGTDSGVGESGEEDEDERWDDIEPFSAAQNGMGVCEVVELLDETENGSERAAINYALLVVGERPELQDSGDEG